MSIYMSLMSCSAHFGGIACFRSVFSHAAFHFRSEVSNETLNESMS